VSMVRTILGVYAIVIVLLGVARLVNPSLSSSSYLKTVVGLAAFTAVLAYGQGIVVLTGGLDLSIPNTMAVVGVTLTGYTLGSDHHRDPRHLHHLGSAAPQRYGLRTPGVCGGKQPEGCVPLGRPRQPDRGVSVRAERAVRGYRRHHGERVQQPELPRHGGSLSAPVTGSSCRRGISDSWGARLLSRHAGRCHPPHRGQHDSLRYKPARRGQADSLRGHHPRCSSSDPAAAAVRACR